MTLVKGLAFVLCVSLAGALADAAGPAGAGIVPVRLTGITARTDGSGTSLVIETDAPAPYVATHPDPLTVLVDFRNVDPGSVGNVAAVAARAAKGPIAGVAVEPSDSLGEPSSRVRITLAQPVAHHVRADRNTVIVAFDRPSSSARPSVAPARPASGAPDPMAALDAPGPDPITALGLDRDHRTAARTVPASLLTRQTAADRPAAQAPAAQQPPAQPPAVQQPPAPPAAPETTLQQAPGTRKFTGHPVSLDFQGADLRAVLRTFAEISGLNIVIDPAVQGSVDVALRDVPWDQALDIILRANKLGYSVDGTIVRIAPLSVLADEEAQRRKLADEQALAGQLQVLTRTLSYAKAADIQALITRSALSQRGTVQVDTRTNTLIITDLPDHIQTATNLINTLDKPQPQVEIEARIVQTNKNYARALGVQWGFNGLVSPTLGNTTNLAFPNSGSLGGRTGVTQGGGAAGSAQPTGVNLPVTGATSAVGLQLGSVNGAFNLDVALSALESSGNARLLSTPRVSTQNNVEAEIQQGIQIPIQVVANNTVTVSFKDAALTLKVTPQITSANTVIMNIAVENASPDFNRAVNGIPPINTQRANTSVLVSDGQTTVIGGIYTSNSSTAEDRTPGLSRIPLLGWLFKRDTVTDQNSELLIFITPRIIRS
ncbi:MAG: type IV pilus secretin PilQ [Betaproteobacteria bacterium]